MNESFWAKKPWGNTKTPKVGEHCRDVFQRAEAVYAAIGSDLAAALRMDAALAELKPMLRAIALLHDIAKLNSSFQEMLRIMIEHDMQLAREELTLRQTYSGDPRSRGRSFA